MHRPAWILAAALIVAGGCAEPLDTSAVAQLVLVTSPTSHTFADTKVYDISSRKLSGVSDVSAIGTQIDGVTEACGDFSAEVESVWYEDGVEQSRQTAMFPFVVQRYDDLDLGVRVQTRLEIYLVFSPGSRGTKTCTVTVDKHATATDPTIALTGKGVAPVMTISTASLPFSARRFNTTSAAQTFTIGNNGDAGQNLTIASVSIGANAEDWVVAFDTSTAIAPGASRDGTVSFSPKATGSQAATLTIAGNDPATPISTIALTGSGLTATVGTSTGSLTIPGTGAGTIVNTTATNTLTISNTAAVNGTSLTVDGVSISGAHASDFSVVGAAFPASVNPGAPLALTVQCRPSAVGTRSATMTIDTDADNAPQDPAVALTCTAVKPDLLVAASVAFGVVAPGSSLSQTLTITAVAGATQAPLTITGLALTGADAGDFAFSDLTFPLTMNPGTSKNVTLTFAPGALGARSATLTIASNDVETPNLGVSLSGTGQAPEITLIAPATGAIGFGDVHVSSTSGATAVTVRNDGNAALAITAASFSGSGAAQFTRSGGPALPASVPAGGVATWNVACSPSLTGAATASFDLASNDVSEPTTAVAVTCTGTNGVLVVSSPTPPVDLGPVRINTSSGDLPVTVRNAGTASLTVTSATIAGAGYTISTPFAQALPFPLAVGATATIGVRLAPGSTGALAGTLTVGYDATSLPIALTGVGTSAISGVSAGALAFSTVVVGQTSPELGVDVHSAGTVPLVVHGASITGPDAAQFSITATPGFPQTLAASGGAPTTAHLGLRCSPASVGVKTATLTFDTNADSAPQDPPVTLTCTGVKPDVGVGPNPVAFGDVAPGTPVQRTLTISNANLATTSSLTVTGLALSGPQQGDFAVSAVTLPLVLAPGQSRDVTVTFTPGGLGGRAATLTVTSNDQETSAVAVPLTGNGFAPELTLTAPASGSIAFGDVQVGSGSSPQTVTVRNDGTATLSISGVSLVGTSAGDFTIVGGAVPPPSLPVAAGATQSWTVRCNPSVAGARTATVRITSNDANEATTDVPLTCTGTQGTLVVQSPATPVGFGAVDVGASSAPATTITLRNAGTGDLVITGAPSISGPFAISTGFPQPPPFVIAPNATTTLSMTFTPTTDGSASGTAQISYDATSLSIGLGGTGRAAIVSTTPAALALGNVVVGSVATTDTITLRNTGSATLGVAAATRSGSNPADFAVVSPAFPQAIAPGATLAVVVRCTPTAVGGRTASLAFDTDADNLPQDPVVPLSCTGVKPDLAVAPPTVSFGDVAPGNAAQTTVTISNANLATTSQLSVTSLVLGGAHAGDFAISPSAAFVLDRNGSQAITVTFAPSALGPRTATLTIASTDQETPAIVVPLGGNGFAPEVTLTAPASGSLAFGDTRVGATSPAQGVTVANDGNAPLTISGATLVGGAAGDYTLSGPALPASLPGAATASWTLACAPTTTGGRSATLRLTTSDASEGTVDVPLSCNGTQGLLVVAAPATPIQLAATDVGATSAEVTITIKNQGTASMQVTGASVTGPFAISTALPATPFPLAPNATVSVGVTFTPTADGVGTGTLTVTSDVAPLIAGVRGTGRAALVSASAATLDFANVLVGSTATTRTFTVSNPGSATLNLTAATLGGAHPGDFVVVAPAFPTTVAPSTTTTITVRCTPIAGGARAATLTIDTDADNAPQDPLLTLACGGVKPDLVVAPPNVAFTPAAPGTPQQLELTVSAGAGASGATLSVAAPALGGAHPADFTVSPATAFTLAPGASRVLTITFTPATFGARTASLTLTSDDQETPSMIVPLTGAGQAPELTIVQPAAAAVAFGDVKVGTTAPAASVQLRDDGNEDLEITGVLVVGAQASSFVLAGPATPATISAATSTTWTVACRPTSVGAKTATLEIRSSDADEGFETLALTCNGTQANLVLATPGATPVSFATTRVGERSPEVTLILQNTGTGPLTINDPGLMSTGEFVVSTPFPTTPPFPLAPGATVALGVRFAPSEGGDLDGTLDVNWDATSLSVPLRGPGRVAVATITPPPDEDGDVVLGASCVGQTGIAQVRVLNTGTAAFQVLGAITSGEAFSVGELTPVTLTPGQATTIDVSIDAGPGDVSGTLDVVTDIPGAPTYAMSLVATGIVDGLGVLPASLVFPATLPSDVSPAQSITVTNCEPGPMTITQAGLQGGDSADFGIVGGPAVPPTTTLEPAGRVQWLVEFRPDTEGGSDATFHVSHDLGPAIDVPLYGFGGTGSPDAGVGPSPDAGTDPDAAPGADGGAPGFDQHSYYACSAGSPSSATLVLVLGAVVVARRRRRRR